MAAAAFKESYSLWAVPPGRLGEQLLAEVVHLAQKTGGRPFPPHVTLLMDIECPKAEALELAAQVAARIKRFPVRFTGVARGSIFYQCVYLLAAKEEGIMAAAAAAREVYGRTTPPFMPHLSLVYSDMGEAEREALVEYEKGRLYDTTPGSTTRLVSEAFDADRLVLWHTPLDDATFESWCYAGEVPLPE